MRDDECTVNAWVDVVRRARLGRTVKAVGLMLATYADPDGTRVHPGLARLSVDCELSYNVVKDAVAKLRAGGLLKLVRAATPHYRADEYRLVLHPDLLERVEVLSPAAHLLEVERLREARRGVYRPAPDEPDSPDQGNLQPAAWAAENTDTGRLQPTPMAAENTDTARLRPTAWAAEPASAGRPAAHGVNAETEPAAHGVLDLQPTPLPPTHQGPSTSTTHQPDDEIRTDVAVSRARAPDEDPIPSSAKCVPHGLAGGTRDDGQPACPVCRGLAKPSRFGRPPPGVVACRPPSNVVPLTRHTA